MSKVMWDGCEKGGIIDLQYSNGNAKIERNLELGNGKVDLAGKEGRINGTRRREDAVMVRGTKKG